MISRPSVGWSAPEMSSVCRLTPLRRSLWKIWPPSTEQYAAEGTIASILCASREIEWLTIGLVDPLP